MKFRHLLFGQEGAFVREWFLGCQSSLLCNLSETTDIGAEGGRSFFYREFVMRQFE